jgi:hypothetical protein
MLAFGHVRKEKKRWCMGTCTSVVQVEIWYFLVECSTTLMVSATSDNKWRVCTAVRTSAVRNTVAGEPKTTESLCYASVWARAQGKKKMVYGHMHKEKKI